MSNLKKWNKRQANEGRSRPLHSLEICLSALALVSCDNSACLEERAYAIRCIDSEGRPLVGARAVFIGQWGGSMQLMHVCDMPLSGKGWLLLKEIELEAWFGRNAGIIRIVRPGIVVEERLWDWRSARELEVRARPHDPEPRTLRIVGMDHRSECPMLGIVESESDLESAVRGLPQNAPSVWLLNSRGETKVWMQAGRRYLLLLLDPMRSSPEKALVADCPERGDIVIASERFSTGLIVWLDKVGIPDAEQGAIVDPVFEVHVAGLLPDGHVMQEYHQLRIIHDRAVGIVPFEELPDGIVARGLQHWGEARDEFELFVGDRNRAGWGGNLRVQRTVAGTWLSTAMHTWMPSTVIAKGTVFGSNGFPVKGASIQMIGHNEALQWNIRGVEVPMSWRAVADTHGQFRIEDVGSVKSKRLRAFCDGLSSPNYEGDDIEFNIVLNR